MAFAQFFVATSNATTTSVTMFGVAGNWKELPDNFPPILWIEVNSTTANLAYNNGLYVEGLSSTGNAQPVRCRVQVLSYEPGTKWFRTSFRTDTDLIPMVGAVCPDTTPDYLLADLRRVTLFYRAIGEGPDPARMV
jgi:hypothetical protein